MLGVGVDIGGCRVERVELGGGPVGSSWKGTHGAFCGCDDVLLPGLGAGDLGVVFLCLKIIELYVYDL